MALIMEIMKTIAHPIGQLALWLEETYQVDTIETIEKWHELTGMNITVNTKEVSCETVKSINVPSTSSSSGKVKKIPKIKDKETCQHVFLTGAKAGDRCSTKPKGGAIFCSAHRPKDSVKSSKTKKSEKVEIDPNFASDSDDQKPDEEKVEVKPKKSSKKKPVDNLDSDDQKPDEEKVEVKPKKSSKNKLVDNLDSDNSELDTPNKPLLTKKRSVSKAIIPPSKQYETDEEIDKDLDLDDE